ncbi:putative uncharacterized protein DDB_G0290521 [Helianthus annuus]|uniref:putative uncharacterized protein DDB_G0290521 n=1 Tax=Helianthus annuus TaxID=4232 RepID=UPI000B8FA2C9|nr:putative uncharacterized protein DDB_G0290521 [Helianthus annuus]
MENLATPEKQPATSQPQQFSPTPTQPSPNTTIPIPPPTQSTQPTSTSPVPSFSTFFPNFDNNQPASTQTTSLQHPTTTQTVNLQQSSPYVRIIPDDTPSPIQTQAPNATSIPQATRPVISQQSQPMPNLYRSTIYDQGNNSGDFDDGYEEYDNYMGQNERQVVNTGSYERQTVGSGATERVNQGNVGYQQYVQPTPIQQMPQQYHQPDPLHQQPAPRRPVVDIPLPPPAPQMQGQARPLPRNLHRPVILPEGIPRRNNQGPVRGIESHSSYTYPLQTTQWARY